MNTFASVFRSKLDAIAMVGAVVGGMILSSHPAPAQETPAASAPVTQEVTVVAPEVVRETVRQNGVKGGPIEMLSLSRGVNYADLDLTTQAGVAEFQKRISDTARAACKQIEDEYPTQRYVLVPANQDCVGTAIKGAAPQASEIIAAATLAAQ